MEAQSLRSELNKRVQKYMKPMRSEIPLAEAGGDWMQQTDGNEMRLQSCDMMTDSTLCAGHCCNDVGAFRSVELLCLHPRHPRDFSVT